MGKKGKGKERAEPSRAILEVHYGDPGEPLRSVKIDVARHQPPADEQLLVGVPPSDKLMYDPRAFGVMAAPQEVDDDAMLAAAAAATLSCETRYYTIEEPALEARGVLGHVDVRSVLKSTALVNALRCCESWDAAHALFWQWPSATRSVQHLDMHEADLDALGRTCVPARSEFQVVFLSTTEYWVASTTSSFQDCGQQGAVAHELLANIAPIRSPVTPENCHRRVPLTVLMAGAEVGDMGTLLGSHSAARVAAIKRKRPDLFARAADAYLALLSKSDRPTALQDFCFVSTVCGEMHEMASDRGVPGAAIAAILSYKAAALRILSGETGRVAAQYYTFMWNCLGLALKRAGEFDMAERAYLWGMMMPPLQLRGRGGAAVLDNLATIRSNLVSASRARGKSAEELRDAARWGIAKQCLWGSEDQPQLNTCSGCLIKTTMRMKLCAKCRWAMYCDEECQAAHWPLHKTECRAMRKKDAVL